jgi:hypothetical protein
MAQLYLARVAATIACVIGAEGLPAQRPTTTRTGSATAKVTRSDQRLHLTMRVMNVS